MLFSTKANGAAPTEKMRIDSSGNVGMGSTNPNSALHVVGDTLGGILLKQNAQISYTPADEANFQQGMTFENAGSGHAFSIGYGQGGVLKFSYFDNSTTYSELGQFNSQGDLNIKGSVIVPSGEGISFGANSHASGMTSEVLDDYEEGTFTPTVNSGGRSTSWAKYTKIGDLVYIVCELTLTSTRTAATFEVGGLPFTNGPNWTPCSFYAQYYNSEGTEQASGAFKASTNAFRVVAFGSEAIGTDFGNGYFSFAGTYKIQ